MTTAAWPWPRPRRLLQPGCLCSRCLLLLCFLAVAAVASNSSGGRARVVTSLPGFDGDLPFHLETGYVEVDEDAGAELFYYFVRAESGAASDAPFVFWLNGGDRCSVLSGLAFEIDAAGRMRSPRRSNQFLSRAIRRHAAAPPIQPKLVVKGTIPGNALAATMGTIAAA